MGNEIHLVKKGERFKRNLPISLKDFKSCVQLFDGLIYDEKDKGLKIYNEDAQDWYPIFWYSSPIHISVKSRALGFEDESEAFEIAKRIADYFDAMLVSDEGSIYHYHKFEHGDTLLTVDDIYDKSWEEIKTLDEVQIYIDNNRIKYEVSNNSKKWWQFWK